MFRPINSTQDKKNLLLDKQCFFHLLFFSVNLSLSYSHQLVSELHLALGKEQEVLK
jgi:hypothetical protein